MSLWIRSQDKNKLVECNHFEIEKLELSPYTSDKKEYVINPFSEEELEKFKTENDIEILDTKVINKVGPFGYYDVVIISYREIKKQTKYVIKDSNCILGEYSTKEKALKVLDEIQEFIVYYENIGNMVYKMPQDINEVVDE